MRRLYFTILLLLLVGCSVAPTRPAPPGLWYAEKETPQQGRHQVYLYFKDDGHFIWWRTKESQEVVMRRWHYYTNDHPGVSLPMAYTRKGNELKGERLLPDRDERGPFGFTTTQTMVGRFEGDKLDIEFVTDMVWISGNHAGTDVVRWSMKQLKTVPDY